MCNDGKSFLPFNSDSYFSTVDEYAYYPVGPWQPGFGGLRAALRLLAEQGSGIRVTAAIRTATVRYDVNGSEGLNQWVAVGASTSDDGDSAPQNIDISSHTGNEFWVQLGIGVKKEGTATPLGQGQAAVQYNLPTQRVELLAGPVNIDTVTTPVGDAWAELFATEWMSFYDLNRISIPYDVFDSTNYSFKFVLQAVRTDPTQEAPTEDDMLASTAGNANGVAIANSFTNANAIDAQFFRVVMKAKQTSGSSEGTGRAWFAVGAEYA